MQMHFFVGLGLAITFLFFASANVVGDEIAGATYDADSYIFIGTKNDSQPGISLFTDNSRGSSNATAFGHFNFGVIKFDDLAGVQTLANGGGQKFLTLTTFSSGSAVFGVSRAGEDILGDYPSGAFGGMTGSANERLAWYQDHIKGNDASYGGYAGGAEHIGVFEFSGAETLSLDVTATVDSWIDGTTNNYGFGLWAVSTSAGQGADYDLASIENTVHSNPILSSSAVPEPSSLGLLGLFGGLAFLRRRRS